MEIIQSPSNEKRESSRHHKGRRKERRLDRSVTEYNSPSYDYEDEETPRRPRQRRQQRKHMHRSHRSHRDRKRRKETRKEYNERSRGIRGLKDPQHPRNFHSSCDNPEEISMY